MNNRNCSYNRKIQSSCNHLKKELGWKFCPLCGIGYTTNPDGGKAGVNNG